VTEHLPAPPPVTVDGAIDNAARLLRMAELETNLALMERLDELAATWLSLAHLLMERGSS